MVFEAEQEVIPTLRAALLQDELAEVVAAGGGGGNGNGRKRKRDNGGGADEDAGACRSCSECSVGFDCCVVQWGLRQAQMWQGAWRRRQW